MSLHPSLVKTASEFKDVFLSSSNQITHGWGKLCRVFLETIKSKRSIRITPQFLLQNCLNSTRGVFATSLYTSAEFTPPSYTGVLPNVFPNYWRETGRPLELFCCKTQRVPRQLLNLAVVARRQPQSLHK